MQKILSVKDLSFDYESTEALSNISFEIEKGDYVALTGPNGAGKTTLIKTILGLEQRKSGDVRLFDQNREVFSDWNKIGYLPQRVNIFNPLFPAKVKEVVGLGLLSQKKFPKIFNQEDAEKIERTLEFLDILNLKNKIISELSGGQQQRVFLARALISDPKLLIMDEPITALDQKTRERFFELIKKLNTEKDVTIIIVTHDASEIGKYANKLMYIDKEIIFYGLFSDFCHSPNMEKYFGKSSQHLICHQH